MWIIVLKTYTGRRPANRWAKAPGPVEFYCELENKARVFDSMGEALAKAHQLEEQNEKVHTLVTSAREVLNNYAATVLEMQEAANS